MNKSRLLGAVCACAIAIFVTPATAAIVYEKVDLFQGTTTFSDTFSIIDAGIYRAILTDFEFPEPMAQSGMAVTTSVDLLGSLNAPGSFTFDATPGEYFVSFFGDAGATTGSGMYGIEISQIPVP